jgi:MoaA/NifB/PqqE/SkfB family radical SAM enzyme
MKQFDLERYLSGGIAQLAKDIVRATRQNPKANVFFANYALAARKAEKRRHSLEKLGEHIPSFLIASITRSCNLNCSGCYDRANRGAKCGGELRVEDWRRIFSQAGEAGVCAILLAGGEPFMRLEVIAEASAHPAIVFPVFTNGTMLEDNAVTLLEKRHNIIPIVSIDGDAAQTNNRRGEGVYEKTERAMARLNEKGLLFGASVTVTHENISTVISDGFLTSLKDKGCKAVVYVEYVPVENPELALNEAGRGLLAEWVRALRSRGEMIALSFPGDEKKSGGCLAAGRGFFHIDASGNAEPCPFSPYSDTNLKTASLRQALGSPLFTKLRESGSLAKERIGACTLFEQAHEVRALAASV